MKLRSVGLALTLLAGGTAIGATTQHLASADTSNKVSSGERPVLISIEPCRIADTRPGDDNVGPRSAPLATGDTHTLDAQQSGTPCSGEIPTDAIALSLNITALGATQQTFLTVWSDGARPTAASLNPAPGQPPVPNAVTTALSSDQRFNVYNEIGNVHIVVDVNGYYVDHDHDDRYPLADDVYTKTEIDAAISPPPPDVERLNVFDFATTGGFKFGNTLEYEGGGGRQCVFTSVGLQTGRYVSSVDLTYEADADVLAGDLNLGVASIRKTPGPVNGTAIVYHLLDFDSPLPDTGPNTSVSINLENVSAPDPGAIPDPDEWNTFAFSCLDSAADVGYFAVDLNFSDAAPLRPSASTPMSDLPSADELLASAE